MNEFLNTKIRLVNGLTFEKAEKALRALGYRWSTCSPDNTPLIAKTAVINTLVTHTDGSIKYSAITEESHDWESHPGSPSTIKDGKIVELANPTFDAFIKALRAIGNEDTVIYDSVHQRPVGQLHQTYYNLFRKGIRHGHQKPCKHHWVGKSEEQYCTKCGAE